MAAVLHNNVQLDKILVGFSRPLPSKPYFLAVVEDQALSVEGTYEAQ